jgi:SAM-dependent methyltransferase
MAVGMSIKGRLQGRLVQKLSRKLMSTMPPRALGQFIESLSNKLAGENPEIGQYALNYNNPQALCFLIDVFPKLQHYLHQYQRDAPVSFLDLGPGFGAAAGLISAMYRSDFLGPRLSVDVMDITEERRSFIELNYPNVRFIHGAIENADPALFWDIVYCSNAIEHHTDPESFIASILSHTRGYAFIVAPYNEAYPLSLDHKHQITEQTFNRFNVVSVSVFKTAAWPMTADGIDRYQILSILKA